jgi:hypothetical protein
MTPPVIHQQISENVLICIRATMQEAKPSLQTGDGPARRWHSSCCFALALNGLSETPV